MFGLLQNEICRVRLNVTVLDELVHEYCVYRGVVDPVSPSSGMLKCLLHLTFPVTFDC